MPDHLEQGLAPRLKPRPWLCKSSTLLQDYYPLTWQRIGGFGRRAADLLARVYSFDLLARALMQPGPPG